jgi:Na+-translocating ferredoxin:NAD+ oxidoreductase RnfE subunit
MRKKMLGRILQVPVWILLIAIFISFIYLSFKGYAGVSGKDFIKYGIFVWTIILLYLIGRIFENKKDYPSF